MKGLNDDCPLYVHIQIQDEYRNNTFHKVFEASKTPTLDSHLNSFSNYKVFLFF